MILRRYPWLKYLAVIGLLITLVGLTAANLQFVERTPAGSDFLPFWTASHAWLVDGLSPYAPEIQSDADNLIYGRAAMPSLGEESYAFLYPFPSLFLTLLYGLLSYPAARAFWMTVLELAVPVTVLLAFGIRKWKTAPTLIAVTMLVALIWYPGFMGMISGQPAILIGLFLTGALLAIRREALLPAGVLMGLATLKPHLSGILILFLLLWGIQRKHWTLVLGFLGTTALLWAGSLLLEPSWMILWARALVQAYNQGLSLTPALGLFADLFPSFARESTWLFIGLAATSLLWEWGSILFGDDRALPWAAAYTVLLSIFLTPPLNYADQILLIIPVIIILDYAEDRWKARSIRMNLILLPGIAATSWLPFLLSESSSGPVIFSYIMPILLFIGMRWSRWWARHASEWWDGNLLR